MDTDIGPSPHTGKLSRLLTGISTCLFRSIAGAQTIRNRVTCGAIMAPENDPASFTHGSLRREPFGSNLARNDRRTEAFFAVKVGVE